jgi:hypothetical protein
MSYRALQGLVRWRLKPRAWPYRVWRPEEIAWREMSQSTYPRKLLGENSWVHNWPTLGKYSQGMKYRALQALMRWMGSLESRGTGYEGLKGYAKRNLTTHLPSESTGWKFLGSQLTYPHEIFSGCWLQGVTGLGTLEVKPIGHAHRVRRPKDIAWKKMSQLTYPWKVLGENSWVHNWPTLWKKNWINFFFGYNVIERIK